MKFFAPVAKIDPSVFDTCRRCSVKDDCLEFAIEQNLDYGVFGGLTGRQRVILRKERECQSK